MKKKIDRFLIIGDSLSDKGTMARSYLALFSGLEGTSPVGRFTNGYVWTDFFCQNVLSKALHATAESILLEPLFELNDNERVVTDESQTYVRTYCEGGMTAHNYFSRRTLNIELGLTQKFLSNLDEMYDEIKKDDDLMVISFEDKAKTLVIEWSGANDLITVNDMPTKEAAEKAVHARIKNVERLIALGYRQFILINLPNLSLTPRFQNGSAHKREAANESALHFNDYLATQMQALVQKYPEHHLSLYDANALFAQAYNNPAAFGLEEEKKHKPFIESKHFQDTQNQLIAKGFMFWDDVHPTQAVHQHLAHDLYQLVFTPKFDFVVPNDDLLRQFQECYGNRWENDLAVCCVGFFRRSRIDYKNADLQTILKHGLYGGGQRTLEVMIKLGWVDKDKRLISTEPLLKEAWRAIEPQDSATNEEIKAELACIN